jgi:tripartite-type tricarboxylate transporter receptor subunit TctC
LPGYEVSVWYGVLAPAGTPSAVINRLNSEIVRIVQLRDIGERWAALGAERSHSAPEQFAAFLKKDLGKWATVVRDSGAKID